MGLRFVFLMVLAFSQSLSAGTFSIDFNSSDVVSDFYFNHKAVEMRKYCNDDQSVCRSLVYFEDAFTSESVKSFQISFVRTVEGKEANATELFILKQDEYFRYLNKSDGAAVLELSDALSFVPENEVAEVVSVIQEDDGDIYIIDFVEQGHDIEFRADEVKVYSPEDVLIELLTLPIVNQ